MEDDSDDVSEEDSDYGSDEDGSDDDGSEDGSDNGGAGDRGENGSADSSEDYGEEEEIYEKCESIMWTLWKNAWQREKSQRDRAGWPCSGHPAVGVSLQ